MVMMIAELSTFLGVMTLIALSPALRPIHARWTNPYRVWIRACRRADCRYTLRAASSRRQRTARRGSAAPDGEPQPAPTVPTDPGAGPNLQSGLSRLEQGRRRDHSSEPPHPASETTHSGAGHTPPVSPAVAGDSQAPVALATSPRAHREGIPAGSTAHRELPAGPTNVPAPGHSLGVLHSEAGTVRDVDTPPQPSSTVSASPTKRLAAVADPPESAAAAGLPTPGWGSGPSVVAADGPVRSV